MPPSCLHRTGSVLCGAAFGGTYTRVVLFVCVTDRSIDPSFILHEPHTRKNIFKNEKLDSVRSVRRWCDRRIWNYRRFFLHDVGSGSYFACFLSYSYASCWLFFSHFFSGCLTAPARLNTNPRSLNLSSRTRSMHRRVHPPERYTRVILRTFSRSVSAAEDAFHSQSPCLESDRTYGVL